MRILVCITGASFVTLGFRLLEFLSEFNNQNYAIISKNAELVLKKEHNKLLNLENFKNIDFFDDSDLSAPLASGSFGIKQTIITPCSINTLAKIHSGISDTLITRAAAVALKERQKLILGVREMPFSTISLRQMADLSSLGVVIAPPVIASYSGINSPRDIENFIIGKWLDCLEIQHNIYKRWN